MELVAELWEENIKVSDIIPTEIFEMSKKESELHAGIHLIRLSSSHYVIQALQNSMNMQASMISNVLLSLLTLV